MLLWQHIQLQLLLCRNGYPCIWSWANTVHFLKLIRNCMCLKWDESFHPIQSNRQHLIYSRKTLEARLALATSKYTSCGVFLSVQRACQIPKFCIITCRDILYFVFWLPYCHTLWRHQYLICIIQQSLISLERDEIWQKGKHLSSSLLKAFQIRLFFNTSIFHFICTLKMATKP